MATFIPLLTADPFVILAGSAITNTGPSVITGDVGLSPTTGAAITGFPPAVVIGTVYAVDGAGPAGSVSNPALVGQAKNDLVTAYNDAVAQPVDATVATELGGTTKNAGVYDSASGTFQITGALTLDAQGDPNAVFIFKTTSTLITASASSIILINGAQACNVFWQVGSSATLGTGSSFVGTIMALTSITLNTEASVDGRILARNGAVTLDTNAVTICSTCPVITLSPTSLPNGIVGFPYPITSLMPSAGTGPFVFSIVGGALPTGITLTPFGDIGGLPVSAGSFTFTVEVEDVNGCIGTQIYTFIINNPIPPCPLITVNPPSLPNGQVGVAYNTIVSTVGATPPLTFSVTSGALPTGLILNPATGQITGTPTIAGGFNFTITATDANGCLGARPYTISVAVVCPIITLLPATLPNGTVGSSYSRTITASAGTAPTTFAVTSGALPTGLTLNPTTGVISGRPTRNGTFTFTITSTDANGCTGTRTYALTIRRRSGGLNISTSNRCVCR